MERDWLRNDRYYFIIALLWTSKGETIGRLHLIPCSNVTASDIPVKDLSQSAAISYISEKPLSTLDLDNLLIGFLKNKISGEPNISPKL